MKSREKLAWRLGHDKSFRHKIKTPDWEGRYIIKIGVDEREGEFRIIDSHNGETILKSNDIDMFFNKIEEVMKEFMDPFDIEAFRWDIKQTMGSYWDKLYEEMLEEGRRINEIS